MTTLLDKANEIEAMQTFNQKEFLQEHIEPQLDRIITLCDKAGINFSCVIHFARRIEDGKDLDSICTMSVMDARTVNSRHLDALEVVDEGKAREIRTKANIAKMLRDLAKSDPEKFPDVDLSDNKEPVQ